MKLDRKKYIKIRHAQASGARTIDDLKKKRNIVIDNEDEYLEIEALLKNACECQNISLDKVVNAVENGAYTIEKVGESTKAGTCCGVCKPLLANIIKIKQ